MEYTYLSLNPLLDRVVIEELAKECWDEVDQAKGYMKFEIDWPVYDLLYKAGSLRYYKILNPEGEPVGFATFLINPHLHCKGEWIAVTDVMYIRPPYRGIGEEFLNLIMEDLKSQNVSWFIFNVKSWLDEGKLADKLGCTLYERSYQRKL